MLDQEKVRKIFDIQIYLILFFLCLSATCFSKDLSKTHTKKYIVIGNNLNVRSKPNVKSSVITQLKICDEVVILNEKREISNINNKKGKWLYIDTNRFEKKGSRKTLKGWVFSYYLARFKDFKRVNRKSPLVSVYLFIYYTFYYYY